MKGVLRIRADADQVHQPVRLTTVSDGRVVPCEESLNITPVARRLEDGEEDPDVGVEVVGDQVSNFRALALSL